MSHLLARIDDVDQIGRNFNVSKKQLGVQYINRPMYNQLLREAALPNRPIIVNGILDGWEASRKWSVEYFSSVLGKLPVLVDSSIDGVFRGDPVNGFSKTEKKIAFDEFIRHLIGADNLQEKLYLSQTDLTQPAFSSLLDDIVIPESIVNAHFLRANMWLGPRGTVSPLHFDPADNLFCQVKGEKMISLFSPDDTNNLYPFSISSEIPHMSQVDIDEPDLSLFPLYSNCRRTDVLLKTGEALFIPAKWWHQVVSVSTSFSVNFWWAFRQDNG